MAAIIFRGRSLRSRRRGRADNGDEVVTLDYRKGIKDNINEVLVNIVKRSGVSKARRLGYFNALVRLCHRFGTSDFDLPYTKEQVLACIRLGFFHEAKEMRASCLRALRYLIQDEEDIEAMIRLNMPHLIARSLDICLDNELERIHALRLVRHLMHVSPHRLPIALVSTLVAIVNDGAAESDKLLHVSLATLCELAQLNPDMMERCGGINSLLHSIQRNSHMPRINEAALSTVLSLLNHPQTRHLIKPNTDLEQMLAPFTDSHYRPQGEKISEKDQSYLEERELHMTACKLAISTTMKSWPGIIRMCRPDSSGLQSLLGVLYLPQMDTRKEIMDILYDIFDLPLPIWSEDFAEVLLSVDPSGMRERWKLKEGFVAQEGEDLLPHLTKTRTNLAENQRALLLSTFIGAGVLEALVEVITMGATPTSIRATILVGELLHMANMLLPTECNHLGHSLPNLIALATSFHIPAEQRHRASKAISNLERFHAMKKRGLVPCSLFLDHLIQCVQRRAASSDSAYRPLRLTREALAASLHMRSPSKASTLLLKHATGRSGKSTVGCVSPVQQCLPVQCLTSSNKNHEGDHDMVTQAVRDSQVLMTKDNLSWDWDLILSLLKWPDEQMRRLEDQSIDRFIRRLIYFFKPTSKLFAAMEFSRPYHARLTGLVGMYLIDFLLDCENDDSVKYLQEWLGDIAQCLSDIKDSRNSLDILLTPGYLQHTCSQYYFLFLGRFSSTPAGEKLLSSTGIYQMLLELCTGASQDIYVKLILSSLDYTRDGISRLLLMKGLTSTSESARLYAVRMLRVLLRAGVPFFSSWGLELLTSQLYDQSQTVALESLSVLQEACEDETYLSAVIKMKPTVLHLGYSGAILLSRFTSSPQGYKYLSETGFLMSELEKWEKTFNQEYVRLVENLLNEAYTSHETSHDGVFPRRSTDTSNSEKNRSVLVPVHLYGEMAQHQDGFQLLMDQDCIQMYLELIRNGDLHTVGNILQVKTALWAVGHIGSSHLGASWLHDENMYPEVIKLAEESGVFSIRGTAFYVLGLMASTHNGAAVLSDYGWESLRRKHNEMWMVTDEAELDVKDRNFPGASSVSLANSGSLYARTVSNTSMDDIILPAITVHENNVENKPYYPRTANFFLGGEEGSIRTISESTSLEELQENNDPITTTGSESKISAPTNSREDNSSPNQLEVVHMRSKSDPAKPKSEKVTEDTKLHSSWQGSRNEQVVTRGDRSGSNEGSKSQCESFDTSTSGISSYDSAGQTSMQPLIEHPQLTPIPSANSVNNENGFVSQTFRQESTEEPSHPSELLRKMSNLKRVPSYKRRYSNPVIGQLPHSQSEETKPIYSIGSPHSLSGYATLRQLRKERANSVDIEGDSDIAIFNDDSPRVYKSKTRSLDFRSSLAKTSGSIRPVSSTVYDEADTPLPNPKRNTLPSSLPRRVSLDLPNSDSYHSDTLLGQESSLLSSQSASLSRLINSAQHKSSNQDYVGICLPVDISLIYQVNEGEDPRSDPARQSSKSQSGSHQSSTSNIVDRTAQRSMSECVDDPDSVLEHHSVSTCLACYKLLPSVNDAHDDELDAEGSVSPYPRSLLNHDISSGNLDKKNKSRTSSLSEVAGNAALPSSASSVTSVESASASHRTGMCEDSPAGLLLIRKEILRLLVNLSSSVATKSVEQGLLILRQRFPRAFQDVCLYSEVCYLLAHFHYRLSARRFIQELFNDINFEKLYEEPRALLGIVETNQEDGDGLDVDLRLERVSETVT